MKITYIIDNLEIGGAQVHLAGLINGISAKSKYDVEIVSLGCISEAIRKRIPGKIPIVSLKMDSARELIFYASFFRLVHHLKKRRQDIVHTYLNTSNVFGVAAALIASAGKVVTSRRDMGQFRTSLIGGLERVLSRWFAARVFCVCQAVAKRTRDTEHIPEGKIKVLLNGVDTAHFKPRGKYNLNHPLTFGMVATMNRVEKGHKELIEAADLASRSCVGKTGFNIVLVGDGPLRGELEELSSRLGTSDYLQFLGEQQDIDSFLDGVDVLVVPSYSEGISNAILEAMAKGLPIIATAVDGNLETVEDGRTGILVPVQDSKALGEAIITYSSDPSLAENHGRNGRERAEELFSMDKMIESYLCQYRALTEDD